MPIKNDTIAAYIVAILEGMKGKRGGIVEQEMTDAIARREQSYYQEGDNERIAYYFCSEA